MLTQSILSSRPNKRNQPLWLVPFIFIRAIVIKLVYCVPNAVRAQGNTHDRRLWRIKGVFVGAAVKSCWRVLSRKQLLGTARGPRKVTFIRIFPTLSSRPNGLSSTILALEHLCHFLRRFFASAREPQLYNSIQTVSEKFDMIHYVTIYFFLFRPLCIVY